MSSYFVPEGVHIKHPGSLYIGGQWVKPIAGGAIEVVSPNTEEVVARVAEAGPEDMDAAVVAAREAFDRGPWPHTTPEERAAKLLEMADYLEKRVPEMGITQTAEVGIMQYMSAGMAYSGLAPLRRYAALSKEFKWVEKRPAQEEGLVGYVVNEPVGVVAAIAPWNSPFSLIMEKVAPALAAGCTLILKPSPETPMEAYIIAEAAEAIGLPPGVVNLVPSQREAADHLVCNHGVDKISFTGSSLAGRRIASVAGERIARVTLELGGKTAAIVHDDFPIDIAAQILGTTITVLSGQICAMPTRAIISAKRHDEFADALAKHMKTIVVGHSDDPAARMGPVAMKRQLERVQSYVDIGKSEGADLITGGVRPEHLNRGYFIEPTLFGNVDPKATIAQEEIFGPVLSLIKADDEDHAIAIANDSIFGLNNIVLTSDPQNAWRIGRQVRAGMIGHNGLRSDFTLPFGGFKQSGLGREGGIEGFRPYVESKTMLLTGEVDTSWT